MSNSASVESVPAGHRVLRYESGPTVSAPTVPGAAGPDGTGAAPGRGSWWFFWTWLVTPHIEFGAVWIGLIVIYFMDVSLLQALIGLFLGSAFGAFTHGVLTATGVRLRVPQLDLGRSAFGKKGNLIITTVMAVISAYGWFIVNSVVAALAINAMFDFSAVWALLIIVVAQFILARIGIGFRSIKRILYPAVGVLLVIAGGFAFVEVDPSTAPESTWDFNSLVAIVVVACFAWAYTIGWSPYATDYSALTPSTGSAKLSGILAAVGLFVATMFLMSIGAVAGVIVGDRRTDNPTADFTSFLPQWLTILVLVGLVLSPMAANGITLRSARNVFRFPALGLDKEASVLVGQLAMTVLAFFLDWAALGNPVANYEGFVMILGVWIGPWLNVILVDQYIKRKTDVTALLYADGLSVKWGLFSVAFGIIASVLLWALQVFDRGFLPHGGLAYAAIGMLVGFYLAAIVYGIGLKRVIKEHEIEAGQIDPHHEHPRLHLVHRHRS